MPEVYIVNPLPTVKVELLLNLVNKKDMSKRLGDTVARSSNFFVSRKSSFTKAIGETLKFC